MAESEQWAEDEDEEDEEGFGEDGGLSLQGWNGEASVYTPATMSHSEDIFTFKGPMFCKNFIQQHPEGCEPPLTSPALFVTLWKELQSTQSSHLPTEGQLLSESHR